MTPKSAFCERHGRRYDASLHAVCPECRAAAAGAPSPLPRGGAPDPTLREASATARFGDDSPRRRQEPRTTSHAGLPAVQGGPALVSARATEHGLPTAPGAPRGTAQGGAAAPVPPGRNTSHGAGPTASGGRTTAMGGRRTTHGRTTARAEARPSQLKTQRPLAAGGAAAAPSTTGTRLHGVAALALFALVGALGYRQWSKSDAATAPLPLSNARPVFDAGPEELAPASGAREVRPRDEPSRAETLRALPAVRHRARRGEVPEICRVPWLDMHAAEKGRTPRDARGRTPLMIAAESGTPEELERLLASGSDVDERDPQGHTALTYAARGGRDAQVATLMRAGADGRTRGLWDEAGGSMSPLDAAFAAGALRTARRIEREILTAFRALAPGDLSAIDEAGDTPLHWVARYADAKAARLLVQRGADLELTNCPSRPGDDIGLHAGDLRAATPLLVAVWAGNVEVARALLEVGADARAVDERGRGAFHVLRHADSIALTGALLRAGADPVLVDRDGKTPADALAASGLRAELTRALASEGRFIPAAPVTITDLVGVIARLGSARGTTPERDDPAPVLALLDADVTLVSATDSRGRTALFEAAARGLPRVADALIARGARTDARDPNGASPLHAARDARAITELVRLGADVDAQDRAGATPLHLRAGDPSSLPAVQALVEAGASTRVRDRRGRTPLDIARESGSAELATYLEAH